MPVRNAGIAAMFDQTADLLELQEHNARMADGG
jgi:hypothetical protein